MQDLKVFFAPVGCPKANIDLEKLGWLLKQQGAEFCTDPADASVAVVFGCGFIDDAKRETIDTVLELADLKSRGCPRHLIMVGCLPQKYGAELVGELPEVDAFVGTSCLGLVPSVLAGLAAGRLDRKLLIEASFEHWAGPCRQYLSGSSPWTRTVMICDGCDNACTYCAIPQMRGPLRSRPIDEILEEIGLLVDQGTREIILAGQDTASYGLDTGGSCLADLLAAAAERNPQQWIRLSYVHPDNLETAVAEVLGRYGNICNYIDMPIQHASQRILARMGRKADIGALRATIDMLRGAVPDIAIRTSVIVGFPGEDEEDFNLLTDFLEEVHFDLVGVFPFSAQPGTAAARSRDEVAEDVKQARLIEVLSLQEQMARAKMQSLVGSTLQVLIEGIDEDGRMLGRSQYDMPEIDRVIRLPQCLTHPGDFTYARIDAVAHTYEWLGSELTN
jgi:ribosomal protein S12 methylthiotransferase